MALTDYGAQAWIGVMFDLSSLPSTWYAALTFQEPGDQWDGSLLADVEPPGLDDYIGTVYARQPVAVGSSDWGVSDAGFVYNLNDINFGTPDDIWGTLTYFALTDDLTAGNLWCFGEFAVPGFYDTDSTDVIIPAGNIVITLGNLLAPIAA